jgi:hypothetical protein
VNHVRNWCHHLGKVTTKGDWSEGMNMSTWSDYLTFDLLSDLCFGKRLDVYNKEDNRFVIELLPNAVKSLYEVCIHDTVIYLISNKCFKARLPPLRFSPPQTAVPDASRRPCWRQNDARPEALHVVLRQCFGTISTDPKRHGQSRGYVKTEGHLLSSISRDRP